MVARKTFLLLLFLILGYPLIGSPSDDSSTLKNGILTCWYKLANSPGEDSIILYLSVYNPNDSISLLISNTWHGTFLNETNSIGLTNRIVFTEGSQKEFILIPAKHTYTVTKKFFSKQKLHKRRTYLFTFEITYREVDNSVIAQGYKSHVSMMDSGNYYELSCDYILVSSKMNIK